MNDLEREREIAGCVALLETDMPASDAAETWEQMRRLVASRSPEQVARMEKERGLN
ncbi:MAG: hypothetical protein KGH75_10440 [Rhodospirillales bacterium]|nr:hypothetical protein [Rhodospirillales bacterium]